MQLEPLTTVPADAISRLVSSDAPVLIFEIDAASIGEHHAPAHRCEVRLIGSVRDGDGGPRRHPGTRELSAVLVLRALTPSRLLACVRAVTRGGATMPPELLCQMLPAGDEDPGANRELTHREFDVLRLLGDGDTTREIAQRLSYSERTVKNIVHDLLVKLNCRTRAHAVGLAARQGVI